MIKIGKISGFIFIMGIILYFSIPGIGAGKKDMDMDKIKSSLNYRNGRFVNLEETPVMNPDSGMWKVMSEFFKKGDTRKPHKPIITKEFNREEFLISDDQVKVVWFGHSTVLLNLNGLIILTDPFFSDRASPVSFAGSKRFSYSVDYSVNDLPDIDIILISHDHYDHLDYKTIKSINKKVVKFIVPLGVSAHLIKWGIKPEKILELDWWESYTQGKSDTITAAPARHFSGRSFKRNTTLWCSYVINVNGHKIYFSGDSGYGKHFVEIGEKYGPFELTFMECGQYNDNWPLIHMHPEETYRAFQDLKGERLIPLHWAKLNLSLHSWTEPVERLIEANGGLNDNLIIPVIGEIVKLNHKYKNTYWWKQ